MTVAPGETLSLQFDLVRTSATGYVITEPTDVEILIDGVRRGSTTGVLDPALAAIAAARGLDPARSSGRLEIPDLPAGSHTIEFRRPCYETLKLGLDVPEPQTKAQVAMLCSEVHAAVPHFDDGAKQFELHKTVNPDDVENSAWHFLCVARSKGIESVRKGLIDVTGDSRIPMMKVQEMLAKYAQETRGEPGS